METINSVSAPSAPVIHFRLPTELEAHEPPEYRGLRRDQVRLLVSSRQSGDVIHARFNQLGDYLRRGDLLVVNNSRTVPALLAARDESSSPIEVRLAHRRSTNRWDALLLNGRQHVGGSGMQLDFGHGLMARVGKRRDDLPFLFQIEFDQCCLALTDMLYKIAEPVRYSYVRDPLPLDLYQTVYAAVPGSVEMPSAGRPFSWELLLRLKRQQIGLATITLHTGLSSTRDDAVDATYPRYDEEYNVPQETAEAVNRARARGGRIVAVGTTVVKTLETVTGTDGIVRPGQGWTKLHIDASHHLRVVDGLITGLHEPAASHLDLLSTFVSSNILNQAYVEAIEHGYLWHEFGDMNLIL